MPKRYEDEEDKRGKKISLFKDLIDQYVSDNDLYKNKKMLKHLEDIRSVPGYKGQLINGAFQVFNFSTNQLAAVEKEKVRITSDEGKNGRVLVIELAALTYFGRPLDDKGDLKFRREGLDIANSTIEDLIWDRKGEEEISSVESESENERNEESEEISSSESENEDSEKEIVLIEQHYTENSVNGIIRRRLVDLYPNVYIYENNLLTFKKGGKKLEPYIAESKNMAVTIKNVGVEVIKLVALAYIGKPENRKYKYVVRKDNTKNEKGEYNDHYSNLMWWYEPVVLDYRIWRMVPDAKQFRMNKLTGRAISFKKGYAVYLNEHKNADGQRCVHVGGRNRGVLKLLKETFPEENFEKPRTIREDRIVEGKHVLRERNGEVKEYISAREVQRDLEEETGLKVSPHLIRKWARDESTALESVWSYVHYEPEEGEMEAVVVMKDEDIDLDFPGHILYSSGVVVHKDYHNQILKNIRETPNSYVKVTLRRNGTRLKISIHKLLALFFVPGRTAEYWMVHHKDEDKGNYALWNLEWVSPSENSLYSLKKGVIGKSIETGLITKHESLKAATLYLRELYKYVSEVPEGERDYSYSATNIAKVCEGARLSAYKHTWEWDE